MIIIIIIIIIIIVNKLTFFVNITLLENINKEFITITSNKRLSLLLYTRSSSR